MAETQAAVGLVRLPASARLPLLTKIVPDHQTFSGADPVTIPSPYKAHTSHDLLSRARRVRSVWRGSPSGLRVQVGHSRQDLAPSCAYWKSWIPGRGLRAGDGRF